MLRRGFLRRRSDPGCLRVASANGKTNLSFSSMSSISCDGHACHVSRTWSAFSMLSHQQPKGLCSNCRPSLDDSPRRSLQHFWNQTYGLLALSVDDLGKIVNMGFKENQWPSIVDSKSASESSFFRILASDVLGKATAQNHQEPSNPDCTNHARCAFFNLSNSTFNATDCHS